MARTIKEIQAQISEALLKENNLSKSTVAEWKLWVFIIASAIYSFEIILDVFKKEINEQSNKITPGTSRWYAEMCYRFQNGHELSFDKKTAMLYYEKTDTEAQIIKMVAIKEILASKQEDLRPRLVIKVAKKDKNSKIVPLSDREKNNFVGYIDAIKFAGTETSVISTTEDKIKYSIDVYFDPVVPVATVQENILFAMDDYKTMIGFDAKLYRQKFLDVVMAVKGVVTCNLVSMERKGASDIEYKPVGIYTELEAGYFEYNKDNCLLKMISINDIENEN